MARGDLSWMGPDNELGRRTAIIGREYVATRTVFFDEFCASATEDGIGQLVILASGLDARAYRLSCLSGVLIAAAITARMTGAVVCSLGRRVIVRRRPAPRASRDLGSHSG
jgi:hypothetical protein